MLTKIKSSKMAKVRLLWVLPVLISVLLVFACNEQPAEVIDAQKSAEIGDIKIYDKVEVMPEYPGGDLELRAFLGANINYPPQAKQGGIKGKVFVSFVVDESGKVCNVEVERGVHELLDQEALRVVSSLPDWKPALRNGRAVKVQYTIPINFALDQNDDTRPKYTEIEVVDDNGNVEKEIVHFVVEEMPEYPGGDEAIKNYIAKSVIYPEEAKQKGIQGKVFVQFVVDQTGKVINVKVVRGVHKLLDAEAVRVISGLPTWKPGVHEGKNVKVSYTVPINFALN